MATPELEQWISANDQRVCPICAPLHRQIFVKGQGPQPPLHPNCRCRRVPVPIASIEPGMLTALGLRQHSAQFMAEQAANRSADLAKRFLIGAAILGAAATLQEIEYRRRHGK